MNMLMLDDDAWRYVFQKRRTPAARIVWVKTAPAAIRRARANSFDVVMLDHDLRPLDGNGMQVARALARSPGLSSGAVYVVHSMNLAQGPRMRRALAQGGLSVAHMPFWIRPFAF
jgi:CheY-like chemotaxis protein